jgi:hypothetical protein
MMTENIDKRARILELVEKATERRPQEPKEETTPWLSSLDLAHADAVEIDWLVDGILPAGCLIMVAAPPSGFKTWLALCLSRAVATGQPFLGRPTRQAPVSYVDRENAKQVLCGRVRLVGGARDFHLWPLWAEPEPPLLGDFRFLERAKGGGLLVFDTLVRFHTADENDATGMATVMGELRRLATAGATVLLLHHKGKDALTDFRGSSEILAGVDIAFILERKGENLLSLRCVKNRLAVEETFNIRVVSDSESFRLVDAGAELAANRQAEETSRLSALCDVIAALEHEERQAPNQSKVIERAVAAMGLGEKAVAELLIVGAGRWWTVAGARPKTYSAVPQDPTPCGIAEYDSASGNGSGEPATEAVRDLFSCSPPIGNEQVNRSTAPGNGSGLPAAEPEAEPEQEVFEI